MATEFSILLYEFIDKAEMTDEEFAKRVGLTKGTISKLKKKPPSSKILAALYQWSKVLGLNDFNKNRLIESAHLARSTTEIQKLVERLRIQLSQMSEQSTDDGTVFADQKAAIALLVKLCRGKGVEIPKGIADLL